MITSTKPTTSIAWEEEADFSSIRYEARPETQGSLMSSKRRLLKWLGILLTVILGAQLLPQALSTCPDFPPVDLPSHFHSLVLRTL